MSCPPCRQQLPDKNDGFAVGHDDEFLVGVFGERHFPGDRIAKVRRQRSVEVVDDRAILGGGAP